MRTHQRLISVISSLLFLVMTAPFLQAENGRDFSAVYTLRDVQEQGDFVSFTLALRVSNHSGADVQDAVVSLLDLLPVRKSHGEFHAVTILDRRNAVVSESFRIPLREYQQWKKGAQPRLEISFQDTAGQAVTRPVEVMPGLVREGN